MKNMQHSMVKFVSCVWKYIMWQKDKLWHVKLTSYFSNSPIEMLTKSTTYAV